MSFFGIGGTAVELYLSLLELFLAIYVWNCNNSASENMRKGVPCLVSTSYMTKAMIAQKYSSSNRRYKMKLQLNYLCEYWFYHGKFQFTLLLLKHQVDTTTCYLLIQFQTITKKYHKKCYYGSIPHTECFYATVTILPYQR